MNGRQILAIVVILIGVFAVVPMVWMGTATVIVGTAWALYDGLGLQLPFLKAPVSGPVGLLCGMGAAFLAALACGLVARWLWKSAT